MLSLLNRRSATWFLVTCFITITRGERRAVTRARGKGGPGPHRGRTPSDAGLRRGGRRPSEVAAFGTLDDGKAPDGDTVYEIGSITKTFTATLLAEAVLAGRVTLETPVAQLLPDFKIPSRSGMQITLGLLGSQHSGLPREPSNLLPKDFGNPYADYDVTKLKAFLAGYQLPRDPGAAYEYSNLGFGLLATALAQSEHTAWSALAEMQILKPLGMTMSGTAFSDAMRAQRAPGHDNMGNAAKNWDFDAFAGTGAMRSTANDMLRYLKANMGIDPSPLTTAMKLAQTPLSEAFRTNHIGLAWMTSRTGIMWHNGETGGYRSFIGFTADRRHGVVILSNTDMDLDDLGFATLNPRVPLSPAYTAIVLPRASLDEYVGTYRLPSKTLLKVFRITDGLFVQTGQGTVPIYPSAPNEFFARAVRASASFTRDANGAVNGLVLHQNGEHAAPKLNASELSPEPQEIAFDAAASGDYVGKYQFDFGAVLDVAAKSDHLEAQLTGQAGLAIFARAKDKFFYKAVDAQLDFERDGGDKVIAAVLHQNGRDLRATRITGQ